MTDICPRCGRVKSGHYAPTKDLRRKKVSLALCALCQMDDYTEALYRKSGSRHPCAWYGKCNPREGTCGRPAGLKAAYLDCCWASGYEQRCHHFREAL